jgi:hypothetical protein
MHTHTLARTRWGAVLVVLSLAAAACGSTVPQSERRTAAGAASTNESGLGGANAATGTSGSGDQAAAGGANATGSASGATGSRSNGGSASAARSAPGVPSAATPGNGPGVDDKTITLGASYAVNSSAANAALGANGISQGDTKAQTQVVLDDINAHGGVGGRKLAVVWHEYDNTSNASADATEQAACDDFTQDHKVFAIFDNGRDTFLSCVEKRGGLVVTSPLTIADTSTYVRFPHYVEVGSMNQDRSATAEVPALLAQGYGSGWNTAAGAPAPGKAKIGILTYDYPTFAHPVESIMVPALAKAGYPVDPADIHKVTWLQSNSDAGALAAAVSSAVLKFRQDGVTHVILRDERGLLTILFLNNAQSQHYFPRYGFTTQNGPQTLVDPGDVPKQQLIGSMGIGWLPQLDITPSQNTDDGPFSNAARRKCVALYKAHGITFSDANAEAGAFDDCAHLWFFRDVVNSLHGGALNRDRFMAAVNNMGSVFEAPGVFGTHFSSTQHDGVGLYRYYAYQDACGCMQYKSGNIAVL